MLFGEDGERSRIGAAAALGALLYTLVQTPGDFLQRGQRALAAVYVALGALIVLLTA